MFPPLVPGAQEALKQMPKPAREAFETWVSFFPVAPLFGVEWRFGELMSPAATGQRPDKAPVARTETNPPKAPGAAAPVETVAEVARESVDAGQAATEEALKAQDTAASTAAEMAGRTAETLEHRTVETARTASAAAEDTARTTAGATKKTAETAGDAAAETASEGAEAAGAAGGKAAETSASAAEAGAAAIGSTGQAKPGNLYRKAPETPDDLKKIHGVGPALEKQLNGLGIYHFSQIAEFSQENLAWVDDNLTAFKGRCFRDDWVGQAREQRRQQA
jgi:NADH-quinone oxidoreductase subunit E